MPALIAATTAVGVALDGVVPEASLGMVYLVPIVGAAVAFGPLQGMLAALWQAAFWFREDDRIFVRYQGVHGPPGTDETVVQLSQEVLKTSTSPGQAAVGLTGDP